MPSSYTCLHYHIVFSTKNRGQAITPDLQPRMFDYIGGIIANENGRLLAAGGVADHVHLLVFLSPQKALSDVMRVVKTNSSKWVHQTFADHGDFGWQDGYGAFTVSASAVARVKDYIAAQPDHHRRVTFQEEFLALLERHGIEFDERYLWK